MSWGEGRDKTGSLGGVDTEDGASASALSKDVVKLGSMSGSELERLMPAQAVSNMFATCASNKQRADSLSYDYKTLARMKKL